MTGRNDAWPRATPPALRSVRCALVASIVAVSALALAGCGGSDNNDAVTPSPEASSTAAASPTTPPPTAGPALDVEELGYRPVEVFPQFAFTRMLDLRWIPGDGGHAVVVTQSGEIYRADLGDDASEAAPYLDISERLIANPGNEEGLLGLAFAPDFETSRRFYVYYSAGEPRRTVLSRFMAGPTQADPASEQVLLEFAQPFPNHNGGALAFGPDGYLYVGLGDGGSAGDPMGNGQNTGVHLGKILRLDVSGDGYTVPPDNPFASGGGAPEVWAYGLRNPWRFSFDTETGDLWAGDVGQNAWEEIDRIERGGNYGWNVLEGFECFRADTCDTSDKVAPRAAYANGDEGCSVTGGYVYRGSAMPELDGWYIYGDFCFGTVWAVDTEDDSIVPVVLMANGPPVSSFAQDADGEIYLVTFDNAIFRLERAG